MCITPGSYAGDERAHCASRSQQQWAREVIPVEACDLMPQAVYRPYRLSEAVAITDANTEGIVELITGTCIHFREDTVVFVHLPVHTQIRLQLIAV
ncbi:Uncharacterised protein [Budvicia aquatica]|uniref:Uncharacterized protein n=1 Tax=Budvicia aquatica TaxID=82979 RepID=A0A484ZG47_9GAMM|nr:Uncharacterised protein [Budvicia aquatica]